MIKVTEYKIAEIFEFKLAIFLMFLFSFLIRYLLILIYDYAKIDCLLIENLKEKRDQKYKTIELTSITKRILKFKKIGNWFLLVALVCTDPIVTLLYYRDGHHLWNNTPKKNFMLFFISTVICTITLAGAIYSILGLIKLIL
ncbi:MAG: hypothetical protein NTU81_00565 [Candidatus Nomurabacteria bacterium]|nr:hypothetical protein [Candidatus Nomurabacteria bacterium]